MSDKPEVFIRYGWKCTCCLVTGEIRVKPEISCDQITREVEDAHRRHSPQCPKLRYTVDRLEDEYIYPSLLA